MLKRAGLKKCVLNLDNPYVYNMEGRRSGDQNLRGRVARQEGGYDGVIIRNTFDLGSCFSDPAANERTTVYIVFDPEKIVDFELWQNGSHGIPSKGTEMTGAAKSQVSRPDVLGPAVKAGPSVMVCSAAAGASGRCALPRHRRHRCGFRTFSVMPKIAESSASISSRFTMRSLTRAI